MEKNSAPKIKQILSNYQDIVRGAHLANGIVAKSVPVEAAELDKCEESMLWELHYGAMLEYRQRRAEKAIAENCPAISLLDLKTELARRILQNCRFCERRCGANRLAGETGHCGVGCVSRYSSEFLHFGEEAELVPSHTIFFSGCTFSCVYCQNWEIAAYPDSGRVADGGELAKLIEIRHLQGSKNVNFVGGNPDPHLYTILGIIGQVESNIAMIWNSNMYHSSETAELLEGVIDLYLADFRYGNDRCAARYSNVPNYFSVVSRNFEVAYAEADVILRHLVLPGHLGCCTKPIMEWVRAKMPSVYFNLMFQYRPEYRVGRHPEINRTLTFEERRRALELAKESGIQLA